MRLSISSKLPGISTTIFTVMSELANDCGAINLSQGFPGFDPPAGLTDRISHYLRNGANQYAPMTGVPSLRRAIANKTARLHACDIDADHEITISTGATEGIFCAIQAVVRPGDEVIVFDPAYDSYEPAITLAGGRTRHIPLAISEDGFDFGIDWNRLRDTINARTRLVIINFPHNPTGAILSAEDLDQLADLLRESQAFLLSDEVYEHIVLDCRTHQSILRHEELRQRSFIISSFGKTFHATGWKVGYCIAPAELSNEFRKVHQFTTFAVSTPMQYALADFLQSNPEFYQQLPAFYQRRRDHFCQLLEKTRLRFKPTRSTFFQIVDYRDISDEGDETLAKRWTRDVGVASIPLTVLCDAPFTGTRLRFCFAKDDETLTAAVEKLRNL